MKKIICLLMCIVLGMAMIGCGASDNKKAEKNETQTSSATKENAAKEDFSIKMNDKYTFTDPKDLDFDKRYVLSGDKNSKLLSDMSNMGYEATNIYEILYVKGDKAVAEYQYFVCKNEQSAKDLEEFYSSQGQKVTREESVLYAYTEGEVVQANITMYASLGNMKEETPEAYITFLQNFQGLVKY